MVRRALVILVGVAGVAVCPAEASAAIFNAACTGSSGDVTSLKNAITQANATPASEDTVALGPGCLDELVAQDNFWYGPNGLPPIGSDITIAGQGATIARADASPKFRFFFVGADPTSQSTLGYATPGAGRLVLRDVTVRGGLAEGGDALGGGGGAGLGGAIFNQGLVILERSTLTANVATGGSSGQGVFGPGGGGGLGEDALGSDGGGMGYRRSVASAAARWGQANRRTAAEVAAGSPPRTTARRRTAWWPERAAARQRARAASVDSWARPGATAPGAAGTVPVVRRVPPERRQPVRGGRRRRQLLHHDAPQRNRRRRGRSRWRGWRWFRKAGPGGARRGDRRWRWRRLRRRRRPRLRPRDGGRQRRRRRGLRWGQRPGRGRDRRPGLRRRHRQQRERRRWRRDGRRDLQHAGRAHDPELHPGRQLGERRPGRGRPGLGRQEHGWGCLQPLRHAQHGSGRRSPATARRPTVPRSTTSSTTASTPAPPDHHAERHDPRERLGRRSTWLRTGRTPRCLARTWARPSPISAQFNLVRTSAQRGTRHGVRLGVDRGPAARLADRERRADPDDGARGGEPGDRRRARRSDSRPTSAASPDPPTSRRCPTRATGPTSARWSCRCRPRRRDPPPAAILPPGQRRTRAAPASGRRSSARAAATGSEVPDGPT